MRPTRDKLSTSNRRSRGDASIISPNIIILLVKITFALLICGSSYLAGSLCGRHSIETYGAPLSVGSLVRSGRVSGEKANDAECEEARKKWIELRVLEGGILI